MGMFVFYKKEIMSDGTDKLNEYKQRYKEWRDISVTQLSNVNNILITLSTGFLIFAVENKKSDFSFSCITLNNVLFGTSIVFMCFSVGYGIVVLFSRLYDFRISRHLALCRQRFYNTHKHALPDNYLGKSDYTDRIKVFWGTILRKIDFINQEEIKTGRNQSIKDRFNKLREKADVLGKATWIWTKYQVLFFLMSAALY